MNRSSELESRTAVDSVDSAATAVVDEPPVEVPELPSGSDEFTEPRLSPAAKRRILITTCQVALLVAILLLWERASGPRRDPNTWIDEFYVSKPSAIWQTLRSWVDRGLLWDAIKVTLQNTVLGFVIGAGLGLIVGFVLGVNQFLASVLQPFLTAVYSIPRLALVPLFILWFGIGMGSKLALVASVVFFLVFYSTYAGVKDVDHELIDKLRLMRANRWQVHTKATLPSAMTFIIAGLGVSGPYALVVAVTAEMFSSNRGMGYLLVRSSGQFNTAGVFAAIFVMMLMGVALMGSIQLLERWLLRWKPRRTAGERG